MEHELKTLPEFFRAVLSGAKTFEARRDDRGFQVGDTLVLQEYDPSFERFTGRHLVFTISYILRDAEQFGVVPGFAILGLGRG